MRSVERAFRVLEALADSPGPAGIPELADATGLPRFTVARMVGTLAERGYVHAVPGRHRYTLGPPLARLGEAASRQVGVSAKRQLAGLAWELGETTSMAVLSGSSILYVLHHSPEGHALRAGPDERAYAHASAVGKAILSELDDASASEVIAASGMPTLTPRSATTPAALFEDVAAARGRGWAVDDQEREIGLRCFAVPVPVQFPHAALSVSGPTSRVDDEFARRAIPLLVAAAEKIAEELRPCLPTCPG